MIQVLSRVARRLLTSARYRTRTKFDIHLTFSSIEDGREAITLLFEQLGTNPDIVRDTGHTTLCGVRATERSVQSALALVDPKRVHVAYERSPHRIERKKRPTPRTRRIIHTE